MVVREQALLLLPEEEDAEISLGAFCFGLKGKGTYKNSQQVPQQPSRTPLRRERSPWWRSVYRTFGALVDFLLPGASE